MARDTQLAGLMRRFIRQQWPVFLILITAGVGWWLAFNYYRDFRNPDVPLVDTPHDVVEAMLDLADVHEGDFLVDLGSGDGRFLIAAGRRRVKSMGIELMPEVAEMSRERIREAGMEGMTKVVRGDIFREDFSSATVVTMFLKIDINARLRPQFDLLKPGTRIVSHMWSMPGATPAKSRAVASRESGMDHNIHLWVTPIDWK